MHISESEILLIQSYLKHKGWPTPQSGINCRTTARHYAECLGEFPQHLEQIPAEVLNWWPNSGLEIPEYITVEESDEVEVEEPPVEEFVNVIVPRLPISVDFPHGTGCEHEWVQKVPTAPIIEQATSGPLVTGLPKADAKPVVTKSRKKRSKGA